MILFIQKILKKNFQNIWNWKADMFNKSLIISLCIFFILMIFTSFIKNETRNTEKDIKKLKKEISILEKEFNNAKVDFVYLSSPEKLRENLAKFDKEKYFSFDYSRFFLSTDEFLKHNSQQTKKLND